eukprot:gene6139-biopygen5352
MPVYSMTGYASVQHSPLPVDVEANAPAATITPTARLGLEIRSVNSRFLDLSFKLPEDLRQLEPSLRELITRQIKRGKVEVRASQDAGDGTSLQAPNHQALQKIAALQDKIHDWLPKARELSVADVLRLTAGNSTPVALEEVAWLALAQQAITALLDARAREGARLTDMLQGHIDQLRTLAEQAAPLVPQLVEQQRQRFLERWKDAMALADGSHLPEAAQDRALTEATAFAIRIDVAEELTRLRSHLDEIARLLSKGGDIGKRLDFLIQELHREANTLGSKSAVLEMTRISVDMKALMELDSGVHPSVSHTTRAPRGQEKHGREYFFASQQEFDAMVLADAFVEWANVHGQRYGTSKKMIEERMAQGSDVVLEIDYQGAIQIKQMYANAVLIFILPPSWEELRSRLERRGEDAPDIIELRMQNAAVELAQAKEFDFVIINEVFERKITMARITVEDCLEQIPNRFQLVLAATYRARMLSQGHTARIESKNKPGVTALREIAAGKVGIEMLKRVS